MYRPCPDCLSFLLQTFPSPADSTFRDRQLFFDSQLKACFDEVDRARLQLALQQFAKENNSSPGDIKEQVDLIFLDFCKAFDKVPHRRLLNKLKHYGITGNLVKWIEQWLTKRNQQVTQENHVSSKLPVKSGVPQGTVLGPLMLLL